MQKFRIILSASFFSLLIGTGALADKEGSNQVLQNRIERESKEQIKEQPIEEALSAVQETRSAANLLAQNKPSEAKAALERALGKLDVLLSNHSAVALVPVSVDIRVIDTKADDATLKRIINEAQGMMALGRYQAARLLLKDLASEIDVAAVNLPLATYPAAIRLASQMLEQQKFEEARAELLRALHSLAIVETTVPLPVVRAQAIVDEVSQQAKGQKIDKAEAAQMLKEADRQLEFAEKLGYGNKKEDFKDLHASIKKLQNDLARDQEPKGLLASIKQDLKSLKEKITKSSSSR